MSINYKQLIQALDDYTFEHCRGGYTDEADKLRDDVINALRDAWDRQVRFNHLCNRLDNAVQVTGDRRIDTDYIRNLLEATSE